MMTRTPRALPLKRSRFQRRDRSPALPRARCLPPGSRHCAHPALARCAPSGCAGSGRKDQDCRPARGGAAKGAPAPGRFCRSRCTMGATTTERFDSPNIAALRTFRLVLLAVLLCCPRAATAQSNTGNVFGSVVDQQGAPLAGGTATLTGTAAPRKAGVESGGVFRFLRVAPGKYTLEVTMPGLVPATRDVQVSVGQNTQVDVTMRLSAVQEDVTVTNTAPFIDARKVESGQTFSGEQLTQIPTARDVWSLIQQIPGVQLDTGN